MSATFGETLQVVMQNKNILAKDVAATIGVHPSYISLLVSGKVKEPTWVKACAIINALGLTVDEFRQLQNINGQSKSNSENCLSDEMNLLLNFRQANGDCQKCISRAIEIMVKTKSIQ